MKKTSMRDIARAVGVSVVTVSNALGGKPGMSEEMREKIRRVADEMNYDYSAQNRTYNRHPLDIGILVPDKYFTLTESYYGMMYKELVQQLAAEGHFALLEILKPGEEEKLELPAMIRNRRVDGLILLGESSKAYYRMLAQCGKPVLFLDFYDEMGSADSVVGDNTYGCYRLTCHLIKEGHTRIGFVGTPLATSSIMDRYLGFYRACLSQGLPLRQEWVLDDRDEAGRIRLPELPEELPDAFVCNCDIVANKLIGMLKEKGFRVPEDISVTGFDDFTGGTQSGPALSTFRMDTNAMIRIAVRRLSDRCFGSNTLFERIVVSGQPVYRDSDIKRN